MKINTKYLRCSKIKQKKFGQLNKKQYLCNRFSEKPKHPTM